jgi:hypothetical protein
MRVTRDNTIGSAMPAATTQAMRKMFATVT